MATKPLVCKLRWQYHELGEFPRYRVWRTDWIGDQFELLSLVQFQILQDMCRRFNIELNEADDD